MTKKSKKSRRPALERRKREKAARKLALARERLAVLEPGGSAERPLTVPSVAVVEVRALSAGCHQCEGELALKDHRAVASDGELLRALDVQCKRCHASRVMWFRVQPNLPS